MVTLYLKSSTTHEARLRALSSYSPSGSQTREMLGGKREQCPPLLGVIDLPLRYINDTFLKNHTEKK